MKVFECELSEEGTKPMVAISPDTNIEDAREVYHALATRADPRT
jgi:hypothetical protein